MAHHGHTRSMSSSIATTVIPLTFECSFPPDLSEHEKKDPYIPAEAWIPLPASPVKSDRATADLGQDHNSQESLLEPGTLNEEAVPLASSQGEEGRDGITSGPEQATLEDPKCLERPETSRSVAGDRNEFMLGHHDQEEELMSLGEPGTIEMHRAASVGQDRHIEVTHNADADGQETPTQSISQGFPMNIDTLLETFRRSRDEAQRCLSLKRKVHSKLRQIGNRKRTVPALQHRSRQLAECLQKDRATTFSSLYSEAEDKASQTDHVDVERAEHDAEMPFLTSASSWTAHISTETEDSVLSLLNSIRNDNTFLASRIAQLPLAHLNYFSRLHRSAAGSEPELIQHAKGNIFGQPPRPPSRFSLKPDSFESMSDLRRDPLQLLVHGIWDCQAGTRSAEYCRRRNVWSSVCARLISTSAPGSDNFCVAVLSELAIEEPWKLRPRFEMLLLEWMQTGAFILDPMSAPHYDGEPEDVRRSRIAADEPRFCDQAVRQLLDLLVGNDADFVPQACLDLIHATLTKIDDASKRKRAAGYFIMVWYCQAFLSDALLSPESHGMLPKHHISAAVRQKLLRAIFGRLKMTVATALAPSSSKMLLSVETTNLARRLIKLFDPSSAAVGMEEYETPTLLSHPSFLVLRRSDLVSICMSLFPNATSSPEPPSTSSLTRAFGMFQSASTATSVGTITPMAGTASSFAPSTSSTSITSDTFFSAPIPPSDGTTFSVSEASSRPLTPGGLLKTIDDSRYVRLAQELQGIAASPQMQQIRKGPDAAGALFYLMDERTSLAPPRPASINCPDGGLEGVTTESQTISASASLYDMLESCLTALSSDTLRNKASRGTESSDAIVEGLTALVRHQIVESSSRFDFHTSHLWHRALTILVDASTSQTHSVLTQLSSAVTSRIQAYEALSTMYQDWCFSLGRRSQGLELRLAALAKTRRALRDKMWFASDVRHSKIYEEAALVARALTTMGRRDSPNPRERGISAWARKKFKVFGPERTEAKALSDMSAGRVRGGKGKLSDIQAELTEAWLVSGSVENFCQGEERIQRFCLELRRAVDKLVGETMMASPGLWSSVLFTRERAEFSGARSRSIAMGFPSAIRSPTSKTTGSSANTPTAGASRIFPFSLSPPHSRQSSDQRDSGFGTGTIASTLSGSSQHQSSLLDSSVRLTTQTHTQTNPEHGLGLYASWPLPPSPVSPNTVSIPTNEQLSPDQKRFLDDLRQTVIALLLSDLGQITWSNGSETDRWVRGEKLGFEDVKLKIASQSAPDLTRLFWPDGGGQKFANQEPGIALPETYREPQREISESPSDNPGSPMISNDHNPTDLAVPLRFPYEDAYTTLLAKFRLSMDPYGKLDALYDLVSLIAVAPPLNEDSIYGSGQSGSKRRFQWPFTAGRPGAGVPRTGLTRLQEVTANCEERRMLSLAMGATSNSNTSARSQNPYSTVIHRPADSSNTSSEWLGDPQIMTLIQALLMDRRFYPATLFRDLQFIAAFVPAHVLDSSPRGAAFWTFGLAAMQLKSGIAAGMVDRAGQILAHHYERDTREPVRNESRGNSPRISSEGAQSEEPSYGIQGDKVYQGKMTAAELANTNLEDAARLYVLAALEGDPTAARELGLFYLTKPEIVKRVTLPLSKPGDVFRSVPYPGAANNGNGGSNQNGGADGKGANAAGGRGVVGASADAMDMDTEADMAGTNGGSSGNAAGGGLDPAIFALALHWMEFAADAGDPDARTFLRENGDFRRD